MNEQARVKQPTAVEFIPATFAERGVAVPFTTPLLAQARLRQARNDQFEFLLPNFTGGKGVYVMPWKAVPSMMTVTLHDRLLFEAVARQETQTPEAIRIASLEVQASGIAGPDAALAAGKAMDEDGQYLVLTQFILVTELLKLVGLGTQDLMRPGMSANDSKKMARAALAKVAHTVKIAPDELSARVESLAPAIAPAGLPQCPQPGRLRILAKRLADFCEEMEVWAAGDPTDAAQLARYISAVGSHTVELVKMRLNQLDKVCSDTKQIIHDDKRVRVGILDHGGRISWLLDGWDFLLAMWNTVRDTPGEAQQTMVADISRLLPTIPREEMAMANSMLDPDELAKIQRRWVRMNEDWRTGSLDMPAVMRMEQVKAGAVQ